MRKFWIASAALLTLAGVPTAAFAAKPVHPVTPATTGATGATGVTKPTVMYVLSGTLSNYTAATKTTSGSITIVVKTSNFEKTPLKGTTLTFTTDSKTHVVLHKGKTIANGDRGMVKVRAVKNSTATSLETKTAFQVIDQGKNK